MSDVDPDLKRLFDRQLAALTPPPPVAHHRRQPSIVPAAAAGILVLVGTAFAFNVNSVAAASGADCASFLTKVQVWAQVHRSELPWTDHSAAHSQLAAMISATGCSPHDSTHDQNHKVVGTHH